jgi:hypothetical protein
MIVRKDSRMLKTWLEKNTMIPWKKREVTRLGKWKFL